MYINEQVSSLSDFVSKLNTFLGTTVGTWTTFINTGAGQFAARKSGSGFDIAFSAQWDTGTPSNLGIYQFLGAYNSGVAPYQQANDSGNGAQSTSNATLGGARRAPIGNTPIQYWAFEDDHYVHVVVEFSSGNFTHLGAGQLFKYGDWTGGEYVYAQLFNQTAISNPGITVNQTTILDGLSNTGGSPSVSNIHEYVATIHCEGLPAQVASGKYAIHAGPVATLGNDRQAAPKARVAFTGGFRGGAIARSLARFDGSDLSGHVPMYPIVTYYWEKASNDAYGPMGYMKDVRGVSIRNYVGGQEVTVGSDTWIVFPTRLKFTGAGSASGTSGEQGIAYRKVTT